jgi:hypothetical protein
MRELSLDDCNHITGGVVPEIIIGVGAIAGGLACAKVTAYFAPVATVIGTVSTAITFGTLGTLAFPVVGTIVCGTAGALAGYVFSEHIATFGAFAGGAIGAGAVVASAIL